MVVYFPRMMWGNRFSELEIKCVNKKEKNVVVWQLLVGVKHGLHLPTKSLSDKVCNILNADIIAIESTEKRCVKNVVRRVHNVIRLSQITVGRLKPGSHRRAYERIKLKTG